MKLKVGDRVEAIGEVTGISLIGFFWCDFCKKKTILDLVCSYSVTS